MVGVVDFNLWVGCVPDLSFQKVEGMLFVFRPWVVRVRFMLKYLLVHFVFAFYFLCLFCLEVPPSQGTHDTALLRKVLMMLLCSNDCCTHHAYMHLYGCFLL